MHCFWHEIRHGGQGKGRMPSTGALREMKPGPAKIQTTVSGSLELQFFPLAQKKVMIEVARSVHHRALCQMRPLSITHTNLLPQRSTS